MTGGRFSAVKGVSGASEPSRTRRVGPESLHRSFTATQPPHTRQFGSATGGKEEKAGRFMPVRAPGGGEGSFAFGRPIRQLRSIASAPRRPPSAGRERYQRLSWFGRSARAVWALQPQHLVPSPASAVAVQRPSSAAAKPSQPTHDGGRTMDRTP